MQWMKNKLGHRSSAVKRTRIMKKTWPAVANLNKALQGDAESDCQSNFEDKNERQIAKFCLELV